MLRGIRGLSEGLGKRWRQLGLIQRQADHESS